MKVFQEFVQCALISAVCAAMLVVFPAYYVSFALQFFGFGICVGVIFALKLGSEQYQLFAVLLKRGLLGRLGDLCFYEGLSRKFYLKCCLHAWAGMYLFGYSWAYFSINGPFHVEVLTCAFAIMYSSGFDVLAQLRNNPKMKLAVKNAKKIMETAHQKMVYAQFFEFLQNVVLLVMGGQHIYRDTVAPPEYYWVYDLLCISMLSSIVGPAVTKVAMMPIFGDFTTMKDSKGACSRTYCCSPGERAYAYHHLVLAGYMTKVFRYRVYIPKFMFLFGSVLPLFIVLPKDIWYSLFHFVYRFNPALFVITLRNQRKLEKDAPWDIRNVASPFGAGSKGTAKMWAVVCKLSVDWVPHWARCMYTYSVYYPIDGLKALSEVDGSQEMIMKLCNKERKRLSESASSKYSVRTGYYSLGGFLLRVSEMPGFCLTDTIGVVHYRRYLRARKLESFAKYLAYSWLEVVDVRFDGIKDEVNQIVGALGKYEEAIYPSTSETVVGDVPCEQMVQFEHVVTVFHWRTHFQSACRQSVKLQLWIFFIVTIVLLVVILEIILSTEFGNVVCSYAISKDENTDNIKWCKCRALATSGGLAMSGGLGVKYLARAVILLVIDVVETCIILGQQRKQTRAAFREVVFDFGTVSRKQHMLWVNSGFAPLALALGGQLPYSVAPLIGISFLESPYCSGIDSWVLTETCTEC